MPKMPPKACSKPGCLAYAVRNGRCISHRLLYKPWASNQGKSRHERGYDSRWYRIRKMIMVRDGYLCKPCQREGMLTKADEVDHIVPKSQGGTDDVANLEAICKCCHKVKTQSESKNGRHN